MKIPSHNPLRMTANILCALTLLLLFACKSNPADDGGGDPDPDPEPGPTAVSFEFMEGNWEVSSTSTGSPGPQTTQMAP